MHSADRALEALAETQFGVVAHAQLLDLGLSRRMIDHRIRIGSLKSLHPRTYAVSGSPPSWERDEMAACLWSSGLASHRSAARLWGLAGCDDDRIEVVTWDLQIVPRAGVAVHHTLRLPPEQMSRRANVPVTSVERTLLDLGAVVSPRRVGIALDDALRQGLTTLGDLDYCLFRTARRGRRGCAALRDLVRRREGVSNTPHSALESMLFGLIGDSSLPTPEPQAEISDDNGRFVARVDFLYPAERLVIEAHSRKWHLADEASFRDQSRHNDLTSLGYRVLYVTWTDIVERPEETVRRIERALAEAGRRMSHANV